MNAAAFFAAVRTSLFSGSLSQSAVDGINAILKAWDEFGDGDLNKLAYVLATPHHETGRTYGPIAENLNYSAAGLRSTFARYFTVAEADAYQRQPEKIANRAYANRMGNGPESSGDGWRYRGRGLVQMTGRDNYSKLGLADNPDAALEVGMAATILVRGMMLGTFTGKNLADYIGGGKADFVEARRIINGTDKAETIAGYAGKFVAALKAAGYGAKTANPAETTTIGGSLIAAIVERQTEIDLRIKNAATVAANLSDELEAIRTAQAALQSDVNGLG